jgi:hypothetical protein
MKRSCICRQTDIQLYVSRIGHVNLAAHLGRPAISVVIIMVPRVLQSSDLLVK